MPFVKSGGKAVAMKSENSSDEIQAAENAARKLGAKSLKIEPYCLPQKNITRNLLLYEKN